MWIFSILKDDLLFCVMSYIAFPVLSGQRDHKVHVSLNSDPYITEWEKWKRDFKIDKDCLLLFFIAFNKESALTTGPPVYKFYKNEDGFITYYCFDHLEKYCTLTFCCTLSPLSQMSHQRSQGREWGHACSQAASQLVSS